MIPPSQRDMRIRRLRGEDWTDPRVRLDAARTICEAFGITRNNQNMTKVANAIEGVVGG